MEILGYMRNGSGGHDWSSYRGLPAKQTPVMHHIVASHDAPTAPQAGGAHSTYVKRSYSDRFIENWGRKLNERQEIRHPEGETPTMQQPPDDATGLLITYTGGDRSKVEECTRRLTELHFQLFRAMRKFRISHQLN